MSPTVPIAHVIDVARLPKVAAIDAGVLMRFLEDRFQDDDAKACRAFVAAMLKEERTLVLPAPSLAEHLRGGGAPPPSTRFLYTVPFDRLAAVRLSETLPLPALQASRVELGRTGPAIKFDAMIIASALRWEAEVLVSVDTGMAKMADRAGMKCRHPEAFYAAQVEMPDT